MSWKVVAPNGNEKDDFTDRAAAESEAEELDGLFDGEVTVERVNDEAEADGGVMPDTGPTVTQDPVSWMPDHFVDDIQGVPVVNRKGYCVLASRYGVSVEAEPETLAEPGEEYAAFRAVAETKNGQRYTGFGTASVDRDDDPTLLNELAETRAMKRAVAWATGIGMTAIEELQGETA